MRQIVYISSACKPLGESDLIAILQTARINNARFGITSMLLYQDRNIMQVLEGPDQAVRALYENIMRDPRHKDLTILLDEPIVTREFASWSMAFHRLSDVPPDALETYSDFLKNPVTVKAFSQNLLPAYELLLLFRKNQRRF